MIKIETVVNFEAIRKRLDSIKEERWGFYISKAANDTAEYVRNKLRSEMPKYIDRPNPFTLNSIAVKRGNKRAPEALVFWRKTGTGHGAGRYLRPIVRGGEGRRLKGFENLLIRNKLMPSGYYCIPSKAAPLDVYGNVSTANINKILSYLRAMAISTDNRSQTKKFSTKRSQYFVVLPGNKLPAGIYERSVQFTGAVRAIFFYVNKVSYKAQFPFEKINSESTKIKFSQALGDALSKYKENV